MNLRGGEIKRGNDGKDYCEGEEEGEGVKGGVVVEEEEGGEGGMVEGVGGILESGRGEVGVVGGVDCGWCGK